MKNNGIDVYKQLRVLVGEFKDGDSIKEEPKNFVLNICSKRKKILLCDICNLLVNSEYTCMESKIYLLNSRYKYSDIAESLEKMGVNKKENAIRQAIYRDRNRFEKDFGQDFYVKLVMQNSEDIEEYENAYIKVIGNLKKNGNLLNEIDLDFSRKKTGTVREIEDEEFVRLLRSLEPYTKIGKERALENISAESLSYLNYILNYSKLQDKDLERLRQFKKLIGIEG